MQPATTKASEWQECKGGPWYPLLSHGGFTAYRIWQRFDGLSWFQRHEWKRADNTSEAGEWILGVSGWLPSAQTA